MSSCPEDFGTAARIAAGATVHAPRCIAYLLRALKGKGDHPFNAIGAKAAIIPA